MRLPILMFRHLLLASVTLFGLFAGGNLTGQEIIVGPGVQVGTLGGGLNEVSGIALSRSLPDTIWAHQDSGDSARFYGLSTSGALHSTITLSGRTAVDWEDMAIGPKPGGGNYLYIGDIGDNGANRNSGVDIIRLTEPVEFGDATLTSADYQVKRVTYPGIIFLREEDAESLFVDPVNDDVYIIQKLAQGRLFRMPANQWNVSGTFSLQSLGNINTETDYRPTAADISPDGKYILVRTSRNQGVNAYLFVRDVQANQTIQSAMQSTPIVVTLRSEPQGESIAWATDGSGFYSISEGSNRPIWYYSFTVTSPSSEIVDQFAFYPSYSGTGDNLDTVKILAREGQGPRTLGYENLINSGKGIEAVGFDIQDLGDPESLSAEDFDFQLSPPGAFVEADNAPGNWVSAPAPSSITVTPASPNRVLIEWPANSIENRWLRVTVKATGATGLPEPAVFYLGHLKGETTGLAGDNFTVAFADIAPIREAAGQTVDAGSILDIDKNGSVTFADISAMRSNIAAQLTNITIP